jgi:hypothetical protein
LRWSYLGAGLDVDFVHVERFAAVCAAQFGVGQLAAAAVAKKNWRAGVPGGPAVPPGGDREQHVAQL